MSRVELIKVAIDASYIMAPNTDSNTKSSSGNNNSSSNINNPKPKSKCCAEGCTQKPAMIIGDCAYCESRFCAQHRLPETHECVKMKQCRQIAKTENTQRLNSQALSSVMNVGY
jgi:predicted nucleic acid binding AN1-type Zn finger protein